MLLDDIEFPLISIIAEIELYGFHLNWKAVDELLIKKKEDLYQYTLALDNIIRQHLITYNPKNRILLSTKVRNIRQKPLNYKTIGLFGDITNAQLVGATQRKDKNGRVSNYKIKQHKGFLNYSSSIDLFKIFAVFEAPLPVKNDSDYFIPFFDSKFKIIKGCGKLWKDNKAQGITYGLNSFTTQEDVLKEMILINQEHPLIDFIKVLLKYRGVETHINNFLSGYREKINKHTGKIHTIYRQCAADNGRFQSGGGKAEPDKINAQNQPAEAEFRNLFIAEPGYSITTADLSGAEVTIMASQARDTTLYKLAVIEDDTHGPIAQQAWRNIYLYRAGLYFERAYVESLWTDAKSFISNYKLGAKKIKTIIAAEG
ncbi:MAG: DNA polymerase, partial [Fusobacterium sp.]